MPDPNRYVDTETGEVVEFNPIAQVPTAPQGTGQDLVQSPIDGEWITRESRLQILENAAVSMRDNWVRSTVELGRLLCEHAALCQDGERVTALFDRLGLSRTGGYRLIRTARTVAQLPKLAQLAESQYSHVVALIEGVDESTLGDIVDGIHPDIELDAAAKMSVRQLQTAVRQLTADKDRLVKEEVKTLNSEITALKDDLSAARAAIDPDIKAARKSARQLREAVQTLTDAADQLMDHIHPLYTGDVSSIKDTLNTSLQSASLRLKECWGKWQDQLAEHGLAD